MKTTTFLKGIAQQHAHDKKKTGFFFFSFCSLKLFLHTAKVKKTKNKTNIRYNDENIICYNNVYCMNQKLISILSTLLVSLRCQALTISKKNILILY